MEPHSRGGRHALVKALEIDVESRTSYKRKLANDVNHCKVVDASDLPDDKGPSIHGWRCFGNTLKFLMPIIQTQRIESGCLL